MKGQSARKKLCACAYKHGRGAEEKMVKVFEVIVEPPPCPKGYLAGSQLTGRAVLETDAEKNYRLIAVSLVGTGKVEWTEGGGEESETRKAKEEFLHETVTVWGDDLGEGQSGTLSAGRHEFPFTFSIPDSCPSSYETQRASSNLDAWIRYVLTGRISTRGALKADHTVEKAVTVVKELRPQLTEPARQQRQDTEGFLCCVSGPVAVTAELPYTGFAVGDRIPLSINVENGTTHNVRVEASLAKRVKLKARSHVLKKPLHIVVQECSGPFRSRSTATWNPQTLIVPDVPTTMESLGGMITISYEVKVQVGLRLGRNLEVSIPVEIGNIAPSNQGLEAGGPVVTSVTTSVAGRTVTTEQYQPWNA